MSWIPSNHDNASLAIYYCYTLLNEFSKVNEPIYQEDVTYPIVRSLGAIYIAEDIVISYPENFPSRLTSYSQIDRRILLVVHRPGCIETIYSTTIVWIEKLLQTPIDDHRKFAVWRILAPYLINIRKCSVDEAFTSHNNKFNNHSPTIVSILPF